jgi:nucleotide-binding universal stress UspA family protein
VTGPLLLCFDGSETAAEAIRCAGELRPGHEALVLTVSTPAEAQLPLAPVGYLVGRMSGLYREWDEIASELAERQARHGCELATAAGLDARPLTAVGKPADTILRVAERHHAALIVLGAARRGTLEGLLGSVSTRVLHQATRPVLVVPGR